MINPSNILTVLKEDSNGPTVVTTNCSQQLADPLNDTFTTNVGPLDAIYIGYDKPINALYFYIDSGFNTTGGSMILEYWSTTGWKSLNFYDQTQFFKRNGTVSWSIPSDLATLEIDGIEKYYVCLYSNDIASNVVFQHVGLVFSDDLDIQIEYPSLLQSAYYPSGKNDFFLYHVSAKNYIMSELLKRGYSKTVDGINEPINEWDVLSIYELKQASLYYAISQIFFNLSDNSSDNYWQKYIEYKQKFNESFNLGMLRIDQDNDGQIDNSETLPTASIRWVR